MSAPILIVDDEAAIRRLLRGALDRAGLVADEAATAAEALTLCNRAQYQAVLLDLGLPDRDGIELIPLLKRLGSAILVLTARDATAEKVAALDLGADDYITKPFDTEELLARVRAALRRQNGGDAGGLQQLGHVMIDRVARRVTVDEAEVHLTPKEYALLTELARHPGRVITHRQLLASVWGEAHLDDVEYLRVTMRSLRHKVEVDPAAPMLLTNEPGIGYRINPPVSP